MNSDRRYFMQLNIPGSRPIDCPEEHLGLYFDAILDVTSYGQLEAQEAMARGTVLQSTDVRCRFWMESPQVSPHFGLQTLARIN